MKPRLLAVKNGTILEAGENSRFPADCPCALLLERIVLSSGSCVILPIRPPIAPYPTFQKR